MKYWTSHGSGCELMLTTVLENPAGMRTYPPNFPVSMPVWASARVANV